jgi:hypothetical protein
MSIQLSEDNHFSWGTCTTSAEYKTVVTAMLTVMSGMDPHMISGTWDGFGLTESSMISPLVKSTLRNGLCGVIEVWFWKLWSLLRYLEAFDRVQPLLTASQNLIVSHPCLNLHVTFISHTC